MELRKIPVTAAAILCLAVPTQTLAGNDLVKGLAVGVAGAAIFCGATGRCGTQQRQQAQPQQQRATTTTTRSAPKKSGISAAQRQENVDVQTALNGFGFPVGGVDGALGPKSRAAISNYQAYMGYPSSGYLDDYQRGVLLDSYRRMQAGEGGQYQQVVAAEGTKGLLKAFNDPSYAARYAGHGASGTYGAGTAAAGAGTVGAAGGYTQPVGHHPQVVAPAPQTPQPPAVVPPQTGNVVTEADTGPVQLPQLEMMGQASASMADRCEIVELATQTNQGPIMVSNMTDPNQALSEQFCEARSYAISVGQSLGANVRATEDQIATSCQQITDAMAAVISALSSDSPDAVTQKASAVNGQIGLQDPATAATYGQLCLGLGYRQDDAKMAMAGTLLMVGAGYAPYGEMMGHHLREGFGASADNGAALPWYNAALKALDNNAQPAFLPSKTGERAGIIRAAIESGQLRASGPARLPTLVPVAAHGAGHVVVPSQ